MGALPLTLFILAGLLLSGCADRVPVAAETPSPAGPGSGQPNLVSGADGKVYLTWIQSGPEGERRLQFAEWNGTAWGEIRTIAEGANLLQNWADFPSLIVLDEGRLAAHWLSRTPETGGGYNINIAVSADGRTWSAPSVPHRDETQTEHGFVSFSPAGDGNVSALWLDARSLETSGSDEVALMHSLIAPDGSPGAEAVVDNRVCECCAPVSIAVDGDIFAVYRDRTAEEIRDIVLVRYSGGVWSEPRLVSADNWKIFACPINGPAIAAGDNHLAVAWYTAAQETPQVKIAFSADRGETFTAPVIVDDGKPIGRVDVTMLPDDVAAVTWIEHSQEGGQVRAKLIDSDGTAHRSIVIAPTSVGTASGFPRIANAGESAVIAWTDVGERRVKTATLR